MTTAVLEPRTYPFDVEDIEYLRHGDRCSRAYSGRAGRGRFRRWSNATAVPGV